LTLDAVIAPDVMLQGEAMQLTRLISNLLDNASKYVPQGGTVSLKVEAGPRLIVADNGPGLDPTLRPRLFERFRRGAVHSQRGGHGLGLALARAIAERHNLSIRAEDNEPGARFIVEPEEVP
jgi:signal transduction histidine kinase